MAVTLDTALTQQFDARPELREQHPRLYKMLTAPDSPRKRRRMARIERAVRKNQGLSDTAEIDWSNIDWEQVFMTILKVLVALLPLLLAI